MYGVYQCTNPGFAGSDEQYEKAKRLVDEQRIVSLDIDDFLPGKSS